MVEGSQTTAALAKGLQKASTLATVEACMGASWETWSGHPLQVQLPYPGPQTMIWDRPQAHAGLQASLHVSLHLAPSFVVAFWKVFHLQIKLRLLRPSLGALPS